ncbi:helix-turn-helix domain-containing protein [Escherichia coli]|uniref:helix-turn-helix domain-containing protein n=1 Tax=Enterobacterales TaxID=91347 RepID=UPI0012B8244F|nr:MULTISPECIES: helix-turn-helix transcriptional regulator [Enterobacteriaceae]ELV3045619.1 helix-turn-helix transcriptional regulator [Enterobacter chengduensis]HBZ9638937.1 helix-turn-helix transcriptional regulator [Citrobacter farmeri]HCA5790365.1 helix-turn-helix transcriptional regulator [Klebsiella pneumoniae]EIW7013803.1 helix-turn-helix transcriptional regulator [Escherichia coli]MWF59180.1 helix-turn-helix domain-containing protein [Escherichia coli]
MSTDYAMKLREIRKAEGLTQKQFSDLSGISLGTIKNYESGQHQAGIQTVERIINVMQFQKYTLWLMTGNTAPDAGQIEPALSLDGPENAATSRRSVRKTG